MSQYENILKLAQTKPVQPTEVAKNLKVTSIIASALLSELVRDKQLKISSLNVGSSPLYYVPANKHQLQNYIDKLNDKDKKTTLLLQKEKILRDKEADPITRVTLRNIKDFAQPLEVGANEQKEVFWKWYLLGDKETEELIKKKLNIKKEQKPQTIKPTVQKKLEKKENKPAPQKENKTTKKETRTEDDFLDNILNYFRQNSIRVVEQVAVKKKSDYDFVIELDSTVGSLIYYCKARKKKKVSEADVSIAVVNGQMKKLPVLFLTDGELSKKAMEIMGKFKGVTFKQI